MPRCNYPKADGSPCRAQALPGKTGCVFHAPDPETAAKRTEGRRRGGKTRCATLQLNVLPNDLPDVPLNTVADVVRLLGQTINQVRRGQLHHTVGNCLGMLASGLIRALEGSELERRLSALEQLQQNKPRRTA